MVSVDKCIGDNCPCKSLERRRLGLNATGFAVVNKALSTIVPPPGMAAALSAAMLADRQEARRRALR